MKHISISKPWMYTSCLIGLLVMVASALGIAVPAYYAEETTNWATQAVGQDMANLLSVSVLFLCAYLLTQKSAKGYLAWLGALVYFIYAYIIYAFFIHFNQLFLAYVAVLGLSVYTLVGGLVGQPLKEIGDTLATNRYAKASSILLFIIGAMFGLLWLSEVIPAIASNTLPKSSADAGLWVNPVHAIDLGLVLPGMILTAILVWRRNYLGYLFTAPWLIFSILMGLGIVASLIINISQGIVAEAIPPLVMVGTIVVASTILLTLFFKDMPAGKR